MHQKRLPGFLKTSYVSEWIHPSKSESSIMGKKFFFILLALLLSVKIPGFAFSDPPVSYLGIEQGLSNNAVTSIFQDHDGFMWFGTFDGLNRYDGYGFKVFRNNFNDSTSLNDNHVRIIADDASHHLWIGTGKGLNIYNAVKANFFSAGFKSWNNTSLQPLKTVVRAIHRIDENGTMLVGTVNNGLLVFEKGSMTGVQIPLPAKRGHEGEYIVTAIAYDNSSQVAWVFVQHQGLCQYDLKHRTLRVVNTAVEMADCLKFDSQRNLWLGNEKGLFRYDMASNAFSTNVLPAALRVMNIFEDKQHMLWISSDGGGVWSMRGGGHNRPVAFLSTTGGSLVNSNAVYAIYDDLQGNKWIGTLRGGINIIRPGATLFNHISFNNAANNNIVNDFVLSFAEDDKNNVWIGTDGAGLRYWDRRNNSFIAYRHNVNDPSTISSDFVTSILRDSYNDIWATTWFGGVNRLKKDTRSFEHFNCMNAQTGLLENNTWQVYEDPQKRLWVSSMNGGALYLFNRKTNTFEVFDAGLKNIHGLFEDGQGQMWAANHTTLMRLDLVNKKHRSYEIGHGVRCIYEDGNRNFWIGTDGGGLLLFNRVNGSFRRFTTSGGLPSNTILRILEDRKNNLWLSTYNGISKFNTIDKTCRNYTQLDGLQSSQFSLNAALKLQSGEFLFGGIRGFNVFHPDSIHERMNSPELFLMGVRVNNKPIEENDSYVNERVSGRVEKIELPYNKAVLSLDYLALDYRGADKIKYGYKLEGWDKNWIDANDIRTANYSWLREGTYTFKIRIKNGAGEWSNETGLLTVVVLPPWYRTWWAFLLYVTLASSLIYLGFVYYERQQRLKYQIQLANYEARLANFEKEKEKELAEKKLSFFTHISHEFRTPLTLIINPVKDLLRKTDSQEEQKELNIVHRNARRLLSLIDQLLIFRKADVGADTMRFSKCNFYDVCNEVFLCFVQQAKMNRQEFVFQCENKELALFIDRQKIEIALFNLLSNAIKFTPEGGSIIFTVSEKENDVEVAITDNGYGIPKEAASRLFEKFYQASAENVPAKTGFGIGLYLVKHFVDRHKGTVSFESVEQEGTTFLVRLKKGTAHLEGEVITKEQQNESVMLEGLKEEWEEEEILTASKPEKLNDVITERQTVLIVDDDKAIRQYLRQVLIEKYLVLEAGDGAQALKLARENFPDLVISDIRMKEMNGVELCTHIKQDESLNHIPVILLTGSNSTEVELESIEGGADVYITKPFDKDILLAKMENLFKRHNELQQYFLNEITLKKNTLKISPEYKEFLEKCIQIVENHLYDDQFTIKTFAAEIGMSHNQLYKKVKLISGQTVTSFIRFIRLRKAAALMIQNDCNVNQAAYQVGISDVKYFRVQFNKLFGMNPSEYIKRYREPFNRTYQISPTVIKDQPKK
jgi:signal transduction histidine kinase/ligand-binding sensor domain-containing protein/DNA-binding NarL/FixJ family response regulator